MARVWQTFKLRDNENLLKNRKNATIRTDLTNHKVVSLNEWLEARKQWSALNNPFLPFCRWVHTQFLRLGSYSIGTLQ